MRSKTGVQPTDAGKLLYKHAQIMLRQLDAAEADIRIDGETISGQVAIGLAPLSTASTLAVPLLKTVRERFPHIVLQVHENIGGIISELIMSGQLDIAFIHDPGEMRGVEFQPILSEDLYLICKPDVLPDRCNTETIEFKQVAPLELIMPRRINTVRQAADLTFRRTGDEPRVVAEIESIPMIGLAVAAGLGSTILPWSAASVVVERSPHLRAFRIVSPTIQVKVSICTSQQFPLSEPAMAVRNILFELAHGFAGIHSSKGVRAISTGTEKTQA